MTMRITTWNVNGIRNPFGYQPWRDKRTFDGMFEILEADIVIMQELKIQRKDLRDDMVLVPGWDCYFSLPKHKKGYSGVGIYCRTSVCAPIRAEEGLLGVLKPPGSPLKYRDMPDDQHIGGYPTEEQIDEMGIDTDMLDAEGRCVALEFPAFVLLGVYSPANSNGLRDDFRYGFVCALDTRIRNLTKMGKRVILTGDLNVSRSEIDTANAEETLRKEGLTHEEYISTPNRRIFNQLLEGGEVVGERDRGREEPVMWDICRGFHPDRKGMFTHWEQKINARPANFGSRIDFVICSISMRSWFCEANIQEGLMGSDHCPVYAVMKETVEVDGSDVHIRDIMNPPGMFKDGKRLREHSFKDYPPFSGKLLPEFDRRRSIRDMFVRKPSQNTTEKSASTSNAPSFKSNSEVAQKPSMELPTSVAERNGATETDIIEAQPMPGNTNVSSSASFSSDISSTDKKRKLSEALPAKPLKRVKSNGASTPTTGAAKGQQSLKGFFKPKNPGPTVSDPPVTPTKGTHVGAKDTSITATSSNIRNHTHSPERTAASIFRSPVHGSTNSSAEVDHSPSQSVGTSRTPRSSALEDATEVIDPIVAKESWSKLFSKPVAPRCEGHNEPCIRLLTKKSGFNCGREFWICPRPVGPSGAKERGTQWRCLTFIWASDWNGSAGA